MHAPHEQLNVTPTACNFHKFLNTGNIVLKNDLQKYILRQFDADKVCFQGLITTGLNYSSAVHTHTAQS